MTTRMSVVKITTINPTTRNQYANNQTVQTLRSLKLTGMAEGLEQQQTQPSTHEELGFDERLALLVDREATYRNNNKVTRLLRVAKLKLQANPEDTVLSVLVEIRISTMAL